MTNHLIEVIIGILCAIVVFFLFVGNTIYRGPNSSVIKNNTYKENGKCYRLEPKIHLCPGGKIYKHDNI